jgi:electron-transferring-flavoprotein dehydrogenase
MEREQLEVDVLFVGAGPACLASAIHLSRLVEDHNKAVEAGGKSGDRLEPILLVIEKGKEIGSHALSGAVVDPCAFEELFEGLSVPEPPFDAEVTNDALYYLTRKSSFRFPITPPPFKNHGYYVASLGKIVRWMADICENRGVEVYPGFPAAELLLEGDQVIGARMGDSGLDPAGNPKSNFQPGIDVLANITVLGEGPRGTLAGQAERKLQLRSEHPQIYAVGVKELWKVPGEIEPGTVFHTFGYPLGSSEFGGGFIYTMQDQLIDLGLVVGLDYQDPRTDPHQLLQQLKTHPFVNKLLHGGELISYGAKAIPEGGYYAMPKLYSGGLLITGDSGGFLNSQRLKGIHLAVKSGILAAERAFEALLKADYSGEHLQSYEQAFESSWARDELWKVRNFRQAFQSGLWRGMLHAGMQFVSGGRGLSDPFPIKAGHTLMKSIQEYPDEVPAEKYDGEVTFDKLSCLFYSDTSHEEEQPSHLKILDSSICDTRCSEEFGHPCLYFCPANVYEIFQDAVQDKLHVNFSNCVHCKTCEIADPYQVILWTPPEGGGGPDWKQM